MARRSRPITRRKERIDLPRQRRRLSGIGAAGVARRPHRTPAEGVVQLTAAGLEPVAFEESGGVEALDHQRDLLGTRCFAVALVQDRADLLHRVIAVEERDQVQERGREHGDLVGESGGIAEGDAPLPLVLDREGLERAEPRVAGEGHSASR